MRKSQIEKLRKATKENLAMRVRELLQPTNVPVKAEPEINEARRKILEMRQVRPIDPPEKRFLY